MGISRVTNKRSEKLIHNGVGPDALWGLYQLILEQDEGLERDTSEFCKRMDTVHDRRDEMCDKYEDLLGWNSLENVLHQYTQYWEFRSKLRFDILYRDYVVEQSEELERDIREITTHMASVDDLFFKMRDKYEGLLGWGFLECVLLRYMEDSLFRYDLPYRDFN